MKMGFSIPDSASGFISQISSNSLDWTETERVNKSKPLSRLSLLLGVLEVPETDEIILKINKYFEDQFEYPLQGIEKIGEILKTEHLKKELDILYSEVFKSLNELNGYLSSISKPSKKKNSEFLGNAKKMIKLSQNSIYSFLEIPK